MAKLEALGFEPVMPNIDFSTENCDVAKDIDQKAKFAWEQYKAIEECDAVYFILPDGYMGNSCKIELGYALASKKHVFFSEKLDDIDFDFYPKAIIPIDQLDMFKELLG